MRSLAMGAVPALTLFFGSMLLPDTPNLLVQRGRKEDGLRVLRRIRGTEDVDVEVCAYAVIHWLADR